MTDPNIERAKQALDDLSADPKAREFARDREIWYYFYDRGLELSRRAGKQEGRVEGREEGRAEGRAEGQKPDSANGMRSLRRTFPEGTAIP
jgi:flagellar biosynthesis/type III secretory pathway protein FliH